MDHLKKYVKLSDGFDRPFRENKAWTFEDSEQAMK